MNATKTTLCMLLAAALGSAATATILWNLEKAGSGHEYYHNRGKYRTLEYPGLKKNRPGIPPGYDFGVPETPISRPQTPMPLPQTKAHLIISEPGHPYCLNDLPRGIILLYDGQPRTAHTSPGDAQ